MQGVLGHWRDGGTAVFPLPGGERVRVRGFEPIEGL
jgi:hypothetical protein